MLLRRMTEHVRAQNWLAVALDFVIVVVGVFIGIQVSNWNEARADRETERVILQRLTADFESILETERDNLETVEAAQNSADALLGAVVSDRLPEETAQLCALMNPARAFRGSPPSSATYEQLVANGDMRLISDETLRVALAEFESQRNQHATYFETQLSTALTLARPFWTAVGVCDASLRAADGRFADQVREMAATPEFAGAVNSMLIQHSNSLSQHTATRERARDALQALEASR